MITRDIIQLIRHRRPGLAPVLDAADLLEIALTTKKHNSKAHTEEIRLTANNETVNIDHLTIAGDMNGNPFTLWVSIMGTLTDPQNSDNIVTRLPAYILLTVTLNKCLLIRGTPSRIAQIIFKRLGGAKHDNTGKSTGTGSAGSNDHARAGKPGNPGIN